MRKVIFEKIYTSVDGITWWLAKPYAEITADWLLTPVRLVDQTGRSDAGREDA